ncbi:glycerophosphodiester phosphodiesterase family protein [Prevotella sp. P5-50]|uniref:glycerophosphodiester phosphodiesterase family protein n=1 Tax=Prevotella sp. P5-50 TaxID=2024217 RepID=UPI000B96802A|nr:glycerophosphodiester phosphodiesterase family protein [Prevotella sp. P5-50]OYP41860.1 hypothetical protein CIK88_03785 [Prevotella sp. P5-50]
MILMSRALLFFIVIVSLCSCEVEAASDINIAEKNPYYCLISSSVDIDSYFSYNPNQYDVIVSGHRGGRLQGYPENCIETFEQILKYIPVFFEIDIRETKDGIAVLLHDDTLDRTTTGEGYLCDYTFEEIQQLYLVDSKGQKTNYRIPSLIDVIKWSQNKVILNFDNKTISTEDLCKIVDNCGAKNCIFTIMSPVMSKEILKYIPDARFSAYISSKEKLDRHRSEGLLSKIVVAYLESYEVTHEDLLDAIHQEGIRCMVATATMGGNSDISRINFLNSVLSTRPDIIETDYPCLMTFFNSIRVPSRL